MEKNIYSLILDADLNEDFVESFKIRNIDQKFLYLDEWAELYYEEKKTDFLYDYYGVNKKILNHLKIEDYFTSKKNLYVSLCCWKSYIEEVIFNRLLDKDIKFEYYGVDSSRSMISMSVDTLRNMKLKQKYILADFFSRDFRNEILRLSKPYGSRLYSIFNNTFGNLNQTRVVNNLNNILRVWDKIWIDVRMRDGLSVSDNLELFNKYCSSLESESRQRFFDNVFSKFGIPKENYSYYISTRNDDVLWALVFDFIAKFSKKTKFSMYGNEIIILPNEDVKITHIYTYDSKRLISFFREHGFKIIKKYVTKSRGHFIFEKV